MNLDEGFVLWDGPGSEGLDSAKTVGIGLFMAPTRLANLEE